MVSLEVCAAVILGAALVAVAFYFFTRESHAAARLPLPPLCGPNLFANVAALTNIDGIQAVQHVYDISNSIIDFGKSSCGTVFRISMLGFTDFVVITDYKLARIVMEGNKDMGVPESEKTAIGRAFDLFPDLGSIFS